MSGKRTLLVIGSTGKQGRGLIHALLAPPEHDSTYHIVALTRDPSGSAAQRLRKSYPEESLSIVSGNLNEPSSIRKVFEDAKESGGLWGVFTVLAFPGMGANADGEERQGKMLADLALEFKVQVYIYSSGMNNGPKYEDQMKLSGLAKLNVEKYCKKLGKDGLPWTIIQPGFFMENFENFIGSIAVGLMKNGLREDTTIGLIASEDIGRVAAGVFRNPEKFHHELLVLVSEYSTMSQLEDSHKRATGQPLSSIHWILAWILTKMNKSTYGLIQALLLHHDARLAGDYSVWKTGKELANAAYHMRTYFEWKSQQKEEEASNGNWNQASIGKLLTGRM